MKKTLFVSTLVLVAFACHRKTIAESEIVLSNKARNEMGSGTKAGIAGQRIFNDRCGSCHGLKPVDKFSRVEWDNILKSMIPKAGLNENESRELRSWIMSQAKN